MTRRQTELIVSVLVVFAVAQIVLWILFENSTATVSQLHDASRGQCYQSNLLRWAINKEEITEARRDRLRKTLYLPQVNCVQAIEHPLTYVAPLPVTVTVRQMVALVDGHTPMPPDRFKRR